MSDYDDETIMQPGNRRPAKRSAAPADAQETRPGANIPADGTPDQSPESSRRAIEQSVELKIPPFQAPGYKLLRELGRGTFGDVWLAEQVFDGAQTGQDKVFVAIKFFRGKDRTQLQRMVDEAKILARLRSDPRIVYLIDHDADAATPFFVMDYMERGSLASQLTDRVMPLDDALRLFREIVEAMAFVHAKGIRHCDLKPGNVLLSADGKPKVADFGQAHLSLEPTDLALGTFFYMAPDQANAEHQVPDSGWDVYGLGALFFAMVTGKPPRFNRQFSDELAQTASLPTKLGMYRAWVYKCPRPKEHRQVAGMDRALADIIDRCIAINPRKRLRDAGAILAALEQRERSRRQKPFLALAAGVFLLLIAAMAGFGLYAVNLSQIDLENRVQSSDLITAHLVANVVRENLSFESMRLDGLASDNEFRTDVLNLGHVKDADPLRTKLETRLAGDVQHSRFNSLVVFDKTGVLRVAALIIDPNNRSNPRFTFLDELHGRKYTWRDYWNRQQDYLDRKTETFPYRPNLDPETGLDVPYIGQPFKSTAANSYVGITISTPILDPESNEQIGLLVGAIRLLDLHRWLDPVEEQGGCAVLIDHHGNCVHHQEAFRKLLIPDGTHAPERRDFHLRQPEAETYWRDGKAKNHVDPYINKAQLAVHVPIEEFDWHVIVQHDRGEVLKEIETIRANLRLTFLVGVAVTAALLAGLWWGFLRFERRKGRLARI